MRHACTRAGWLRALVALVSVLSSLVVVVAPAAASWPGGEGLVVYAGLDPQQQTDPTRKLDPFVATGLRSFRPGVPGSVRQVTADPTDLDPQVSPDGRLVVFRRAIDQIPGESMYGIFVASIDGSEVRQLTDGGPGGGSDIEPTFYPSGKRVAFIRLGGSEDRAGHGDIYSIGVDGSESRRVTASAAQERAPAVSPTGRQIAFQCGLMPPLESNDRHICSIRPGGSHRRDLTPGFEHRQEAFDPDFSPSGRIIAFTLGPGTAADIATMRANGTHVRALTNRGRHGGRTFPRQAGYDETAFSPGGDSVVASRESDRARASCASDSTTPRIPARSERASAARPCGHRCADRAEDEGCRAFARERIEEPRVAAPRFGHRITSEYPSLSRL